MSKPKILLQLDTDPQPSVFDSVVAADCEVDHLFRHGGITPANCVGLVHGAIFTRGPDDLRNTAIFIGGNNVQAGDALAEAVAGAFVGPMRVSVLVDGGGANTTAAAAVLSAAKHLELKGTTALVLAATGAVGTRVVRLLARQGARVRVASRDRTRAQQVCDAVRQKVPDAQLEAIGAQDAQQSLDGVQLIVAAGAAGVELLSEDVRRSAKSLKVAIDLNAVPPLGLAGVAVTDKAREREGAICYGALGVGGLKMKIHKAAIRRLFETNNLRLDAEEVFELGRGI